MRLRQIINWALVAIWMTVIFMFSAQTGEESGGLSAIFSTFLLELSQKINPDITLSQVDSLIRSLAHMTIYLILAFLYMNAIMYRRKTSFKLAAIALLFCVIYAFSDEFHQSLVPGRVMDVADIAVDTMGAIIGIGMRCGASVIAKRIGG